MQTINQVLQAFNHWAHIRILKFSGNNSIQLRFLCMYIFTRSRPSRREKIDWHITSESVYFKGAFKTTPWESSASAAGPRGACNIFKGSSSYCMLSWIYIFPLNKAKKLNTYNKSVQLYFKIGNDWNCSTTSLWLLYITLDPEVIGIFVV